jgi:hypothetical protein
MELDITQLDFNSLTIGEMEDIEDVCDMAIDDFFANAGVKGAKMAYILIKRDKPEFTWEESKDIDIQLAKGAVDDPKALPSLNGTGSTTLKADKLSSSSAAR